MDVVISNIANNNEVKLYKYRWVVLGIFCLFTINNFIQFLEFSIISNIVTKYYNVDELLVDISGLIFFIVYIFSFLPISFLIEKYNMKITAIVSTGLTLAGNLIKLATTKESFYVAIIGQGLCAIGQVYMISIPTKFASLWFGPKEVSTACAVAILGTQLGAALGSLIPTLMVEDASDGEIAKGIFNMILFNAICSVVILIVVILFFRAKPKLPPSQSQLNLINSENQESMTKHLKNIVKLKDFWILMLCFGGCNGIWNSFGIKLNSLYTEFFPKGATDAGIIGLLAIISGGCIGSVVFGLILDKTHKFKRTSFFALFFSSLSLILVTLSFYYQSRLGSFISIPVFGFFLASTLVIGFEYVLEITYPIPESISCSLLNAFLYIVAIVHTFILEGLFATIGYINATIVVVIVLFLLALLSLTVTSDLKRLDANLKNQISAARENAGYVQD